ncbi:hypothetical protein [Sphingobacterium bambusae]|uniref:Uncharacterized protein n=1 Tax=Sphingobacterium bambusae TaxID=662858 RepID=A0ABW6BN83_9SPHI
MQQKFATGFWILLPYKSIAPVPGLGTKEYVVVSTEYVDKDGGKY